MGCTACKVSESDSQWFQGTFKNTQENQYPTGGLLNYKQKQAWEQYVHIIGLPASGFWDDNHQYKHTCFKQIKKDIMRTFPDSPFFGIKSNLNRFQLLLQKFAVYFPRVGYTQGINFVAGYLLLCGYDDQSAFNMLTRISVHQQILALGLYQDDFLLNRFYCEVFWKLLKKKMPKICDKLQKAQIPDQIWIFQWFISFYLYSFPIEIMKSFWNFILFKKQFSLVLLALGLMKCLKKDLIHLSDDDQIQYFEYFDSLKLLEVAKVKIDIKKVISYANSITKSDIDEAISSTQCYNNPYRKYFVCNSPMSQKQQWIGMITKLQSDRRSFRMNPDSSVYQRNRQITQHLQNFVISKINKLYQSDFRKSKATIRNSNFSIIKDLSIVHSLPQQPQRTKKTIYYYNNQQKRIK